MGDFLSPQKRDVVERLRRRIDEYRRHHGQCVGQYQPTVNGLYEQHRQDTLLLHQRWLESRAKKAAKHTKTAKDSSQSEPRNHILTHKLLKRKLDNNSENANLDPNLAEETGSPQGKIPRTSVKSESAESKLPSLSVQIVQKITPQQQERSQTIHTKLTVSSTVKTGPSDSPEGGQGNHGTSTNVQTSTNIECKQEPQEDSQCGGGSSNSSNTTFAESFGIEDVEELQAILDTLENENGEIPREIIEEFEEVCNNSINHEKNEPDLPKDQMDLPVFSGTNSKRSPGMFADPVNQQANVNPMYDNSASMNHNMNNMGAPTATQAPGYRPPAPPAVPGNGPLLTIGESGPAAETLKQMAAQHQNQDQGQYAGMKGPMPPHYGQIPPNPGPEHLPEGYGPGPRGGQIPGYPGYENYNAVTSQQQGSMYPYNQQTQTHVANMHRHNMQARIPVGQDPSLSYGGTKPLSHYGEPVAGRAAQEPSSLQQLQNQVQSHFQQTQGQGQSAQGQHMQITQSQHMQMSHGNQRLQMSQTQQMQIHGAPSQPISVAQQQSFSMSQGMGGQQNQSQYMNEQMKMQLIQEKLHQEQRQREAEQQRQAQMQSYMNRAPPEYQNKMQVPNGTYTTNNMATNPLQTMQNMVNQTSQSMQPNAAPNGMYHGPVKSEMGQMSTQNPMGQVNAHAMSQMSSQATTNGSPMPRGPGTPVAGPEMPNYPQAQRQGMYPGPPMASQNGPTGTTQNRPSKASTPTYTSAIMRNQRPPNVNVGPDGLNISQQRSHGGEWPRQMMPGQRQPGPQQMNRPRMPASNMMQYGGYSSPTAMSIANAQRMQMHQQQAMHAQQQRSAIHGGNAMAQQNASIMMHQQQMAQVQMQNNRNMANMTMSQSASLSTNSHPNQTHQHPHPNHPTPQGYHPQNQPNNNSDFPLDFLDNAQTNNPDFFESMVQNANPSDFNLIDEIFGK